MTETDLKARVALESMRATLSQFKGEIQDWDKVEANYTAVMDSIHKSEILSKDLQKVQKVNDAKTNEVDTLKRIIVKLTTKDSLDRIDEIVSRNPELRRLHGCPVTHEVCNTSPCVLCNCPAKTYWVNDSIKYLQRTYPDIEWQGFEL